MSRHCVVEIMAYSILAVSAIILAHRLHKTDKRGCVDQNHYQLTALSS
ncbi:MAG: hypothetical protein HRU25_10045 [Psychrobium sp.]|nr:hypothetical protein [Psychrobium sp.]